ncbi:MAG: MFS transporter [Desulfovibrionaceae bacterium]
MNVSLNDVAGNGVRNRRMYLFLLTLTIASTVAFQGWRTLYNNFAVDVAGLSGLQNGMVQSLREVPGFLSLLVIYLLFFISEHRLAALSVAILGLGTAATGFFPSYYGLIFTVLAMSFGFHYYETLNQSLTLQYFDRTTAPIIFGRLRGIASGINLLVGGAVFAMSLFLDFKGMYVVMGGLVVVVGLWCATRNPTDRDLPPQHKKMVFKRRYWLYYALTFLAGARRQVFVAFAVFLMVSKFNYTVRDITVLFVVNNVINWYLSPAIGRAVNRFGERPVLTLEYAALLVIFTGYAFTDSWLVAGALYVLDHIFFNFALAIRTYFQKIADPADIAPSMAVGFTINHIAAVVIPALGGALWLVDYRIVFLGAAGLAFLSLLFTQCIPSRRNQ